MPNHQNKSRLALLALAAGATVSTSGCVPPSARQALPLSQTQPPAARGEASAAKVQEASAAIPPNLDNFVARPEPAFAWSEESRQGTLTRLNVTSQEWQGSQWKHAVEIVRPAREAAPGAAMIVINFGNPTAQQTFIAQLASNATGLTIVNAFNVPNQPLWGRYEDDLIAYTFTKYLEQDDPNSDWPLLLPMTKSATQVMRAVEEWSKKENNGGAISKWGVSGASKRGWTSWLVAAVEEKAHPGRVIGIVPMVYDNLNLTLQMPHQKASWGGYSEMIADYSRRGLPDIVATPEGRRLAAIVDPWTYRERLKLPKLLINGSNDRYWPLDAFNLYRRGLSGPTNVFYAPNSGHMLNGNEARVAGITATWFKQVAQGKAPPQVLASVVDAQGRAADAAPGEVLASGAGRKCRLQVLDGEGRPLAPRVARVWAARSATRDLRKSRWEPIDLQPSPGTPNVFEIALDDPRLNGEGAEAGDFHALFGEVELPGGVGDDAPQGARGAVRVPFALSSPITIWK